MTRKQLKEKTPHGYSKIRAKKAGVKASSVSRFLNGKMDSVKIEMAALEVLAELSEKRSELLARIN